KPMPLRSNLMNLARSDRRAAIEQDAGLPRPARCWRVCLGLAGAWLLTASFATAEAGALRAGAATSNITPPLGELIVGGWSPIPATYIHDELHARCVVLNDGTTTLAIVLCDNVGIPREVFDRAKEFIAAECSIPPSHVLCAAT